MTILKKLQAYDQATLERLLLLCETKSAGTSILTPDDAAAVLIPHLVGFETERLVVIGMDRRNRLVDVETLTTGSDAFTVVCPKQILRWALTRKRVVVGIVLGHNHPSGDPTPSSQDRDVTKRVRRACDIVGIQLIDHIVVGNGNWARVEEDCHD